MVELQTLAVVEGAMVMQQPYLKVLLLAQH